MDFFNFKKSIIRPDPICEFCHPYRPTHVADRVGFLVEWMLRPVAHAVPHVFEETLWCGFIRLLIFLHLARWQSVSSNVYEGKRRELWRAAEARSVPFERLFFFGLPTTTHRVFLRGRWIVTDELLHTTSSVSPFHPAINDKAAMGCLLREEGIPVPDGGACWTAFRARNRARSLSPCVIKARDGSLSKHVMIKPDDLHEAVRVVKQVCPSVIVERFIEGDVFRATTVHGQLVGVVRRDPVEQGRKVVMADGARMVDVTDELHSKNRELFERTALLVGGAILGIDFITTDPSRAWNEVELKVIELNSFPNFEMHLYPDEGTPRDIAGAYWDGLL
ncbi:MAG: Cyanophycin synthetase [Candidatus Uhrbacteria bacterium GW2011_GWC2_53_7]|uniref:Cyanophycin synthetase n=1 Tax=Candidatus Uhrbacteria bacterium GW2011_GWC2_53_7 TaxID=1618986 RepID=A0A0G1XZ29_9BACT|nr:MAG: Cyanophycin synthetase [Parcubacteria group bacterium GW2011_GWA2_53_21]KKW36110.1 MAG: Cyanophycin synthetase [Candidatus Uhrbacteria bacterium GW2011_GWC2_53_7]